MVNEPERKILGVAIDFDAFHWLHVEGTTQDVEGALRDALASGRGFAHFTLLDGSPATVQANLVRCLRPIWEEAEPQKPVE
jgi:hypothetical protein